MFTDAEVEVGTGRQSEAAIESAALVHPRLGRSEAQGERRRNPEDGETELAAPRKSEEPGDGEPDLAGPRPDQRGRRQLPPLQPRARPRPQRRRRRRRRRRGGRRRGVLLREQRSREGGSERRRRRRRGRGGIAEGGATATATAAGVPGVRGEGVVGAAAAVPAPLPLRGVRAQPP